MSASRNSLGRLLAASLLFVAAPAPLALFAQASPPPPKRMRADASPGGARRDTARFFLLQRMREELELTDSQSLKVLDLIRTMDDERIAHRTTIHSIIDRMQALLDSEEATDAQFKEQVSQYQKERLRFEARLRELDQKVLDILTPRQQAGFLLLKRSLLEHHGHGAEGEGNHHGRHRRGRNHP